MAVFSVEWPPWAFAPWALSSCPCSKSSARALLLVSPRPHAAHLAVWKSVYFGQQTYLFQQQEDVPVSADGTFTLYNVEPESQVRHAERLSYSKPRHAPSPVFSAASALSASPPLSHCLALSFLCRSPSATCGDRKRAASPRQCPGATFPRCCTTPLTRMPTTPWPGERLPTAGPAPQSGPPPLHLTLPLTLFVSLWAAFLNRYFSDMCGSFSAVKNGTGGVLRQHVSLCSPRL